MTKLPELGGGVQLIWVMPERKRIFFNDVFPQSQSNTTQTQSQMFIAHADRHFLPLWMQPTQPNPSGSALYYSCTYLSGCSQTQPSQVDKCIQPQPH